MSKVIGYSRISSSVQELDVQKQLLLEYAQRHRMIIDEFIESETSSRLSPKERKINELINKLNSDDILLVAELSRLGRNMLETLNIINELTVKGIQIIFIRQPELSTNSQHGKLLMAIYSYFAESEREFISIRTKSGLATARAKGQLLGRPRGAKNSKGSPFDELKKDILKHLKLGIPLNSILKIINNQSEHNLSYSALRYYIEHDRELNGVK
ncbi:MAG: recombinase family protein [Candidatus Kapabacteria bacterium]|nr:recombinase family protein [Ignavibacteriota bacterium]MCW5885347.1 recombinase family protein [Candidatus Kapabacteria bacterium]